MSGVSRAGAYFGPLAKVARVNYNLLVITNAPHTVQKYLFPAFLALSVVALAGASCDKGSNITPVTADNADVVRAIDNAEGQGSAKAAQPKSQPPPAAEPVSGVDVSALDEAKQSRFYALADVLASPCGKAHSLRTSLAEDKDCKRAPFAVRYVLEMLTDEADDKDIKQFYQDRYKKGLERKSIELSATPSSGPPDAPVKVVEFYDYGCPSCKQFAPILKEAVAGFPDQVVVYYKQFPLSGHVNSKPAAQAALAADKQEKFEEMHAMLFAKAPYHAKPQLLGYAKQLGLDMARFEADFAAARAHVETHQKQGNAAGVNGTPTTYINGLMYEGPYHPKYIRMWIEEELAVNR